MPKTWKCPFWQYEQKGKVFCAGARLDFKSGAAREDYFSLYCAHAPGWENCTIAQNLCRDYERKMKEEDEK